VEERGLQVKEVDAMLPKWCTKTRKLVISSESSKKKVEVDAMLPKWCTRTRKPVISSKLSLEKEEEDKATLIK